MLNNFLRYLLSPFNESQPGLELGRKNLTHKLMALFIFSMKVIRVYGGIGIALGERRKHRWVEGENSNGMWHRGEFSRMGVEERHKKFRP